MLLVFDFLAAHGKHGFGSRAEDRRGRIDVSMLLFLWRGRRLLAVFHPRVVLMPLLIRLCVGLRLVHCRVGRFASCRRCRSVAVEG